MDRQEKSLTGSCAVCESEALVLLSTVDRYKSGLESAVCRNCGLVQHANIPSDDELSEFYTSKYRLAYNGEASPSARRVYREWHRTAERFESLKNFVSPDSKVFEVGAGIGCNLKHFEQFGCTVHGIEPGEGFSSYAKHNMALDVRCKFLESIENEAKQDHDLVLLIHVLEHLPNPIDALQRIRAFLRPEGKLYIEVPNFGRPHAAPDKIFHYGHIFNFTDVSLTNVAHRQGFRVDTIEMGPQQSVNLCLVLTPDPAAEKIEIINGYSKAIDAFRRYTPLSYRMRWSKLREAYRKIRDRTGELLFAKKLVTRLHASNAKPRHSEQTIKSRNAA